MMTELDVSKLLTVASMIDNRTVQPETVREWHRLIRDLDPGVARHAMEMHFSESDRYLLPSHVLANATRISRQATTTPALENPASCSHKYTADGWCLLCATHRDGHDGDR